MLALLKAIKAHRRCRISVLVDDGRVEKFSLDSMREAALVPVQEINRPAKIKKLLTD